MVHHVLPAAATGVHLECSRYFQGSSCLSDANNHNSLLTLSFSPFPGVPFSKPLYTLSYLFLSSGVSGFVLTAMYYVVSSNVCSTIEVYHGKTVKQCTEWISYE